MTVDIDNLANDIFNEIDTKQTVSKKVTQFLLPGKGRKKCANPNCKVFVGVRSIVCVCGYEFEFGSVKQKQAEQEQTIDAITEEDRQYAIAINCVGNPRLVFAGSGPCPAEPPRCEQDDVNRFCDEVVYDGVANRKVYTPRAIKNWIQHTDIKDKTKEQIYDMIDNWYNQKVMSVGVDV